MSDFEGVKVGDEIVVRTGFSRSTEKRSVVRVTATRFTDNRGNQWRKNGRRWGSAGYYGPFSCEAYSPEKHDAELQKCEMKDKRFGLRALDWQAMTDDQIERIWAITKEPPDA